MSIVTKNEPAALCVVLPVTEGLLQEKDALTRTFVSLRAQTQPLHLLALVSPALQPAFDAAAQQLDVGAVCLPWEGEYGAAALNAALAAAEDEFIAFLRPGDAYKNGCHLRDAVAFLTAHGEIDYTAACTGFANYLHPQPLDHPTNGMLEYLAGKSGQKGGFVVELSEHPAAINTVLYAGVFRTAAAREIGFSERLPYEFAEDFMLRLEISRPRYGVLRGHRLQSRHAFEDMPELYLPTLQWDYYIPSLENFLLPLSRGAAAHTQNSVYYLLQWKFRANQNTADKLVLTGEAIDEFLEAAGRVLRGVSDRVLFTSAPWNRIAKEMQRNMAGLKYGTFAMPVRCRVAFEPALRWQGRDSDLVAYYNDVPFDYLRRAPVSIALMEYRDGQLLIEGTYPRIFLDHCRLVAEWNGQRYELVPNDRYTLTKFFGRSAYKAYSFSVRLPVEGREGRVRFLVECEEFSHAPAWHFVFGHAKLTEKLPGSYWRAGGMMFDMAAPGALRIRRRRLLRSFGRELRLWGDMVKKGHGSRLLGLKAIGLRALYWITRPSYCRRHIWVTFDKLYKGGDCGEYFYRYANAQQDGIEVQYILNGDSPFFPALRKEGLRPVRRTSVRQLLGFLNADIIFATHTNIYSFCSFGGKIEFFFRDLYRFDVTCIQHGLTTQAIAMYQHRLKDNTRRYYCASKYEIQSLLHPVYGYEREALCLTGVPRHDGLVDRSKKQILLTPTWRQNLALPSIMGTARRYNAEFKHSTYYRYLNELIHDPALLACAREHGYTVKYLLHPAVSVQARDFSTEGIDDVVEILTGSGDLSYEQLLTESALMVTDYSGVQFDFAYQRKPIVYYHHAEIPPHYEEGCFDYETMAFGEICRDNPTTVATLIDYMENGCRMKEEFIARADDFFAFSDHNNCARIYADAMEHLQRPRMARRGN